MGYRGRHTAAAARRDRRCAQRRRRARGRVLGAAGLGAGIGMMLAGVAPVLSPPMTTLASAPPHDRLAESSPHAAPAVPQQAPPERQLADPRRLTIPRIGIEAPVQPLGLTADGTLAVPHDAAASGWYADGPEPGERGPAVIVGHLDSRRGPGVFYRLDQVAPGDAVVVEAADGTRSTFAVERIERHPKARFPTAAVYGDTPAPVLRLITCGGEFDRAARSYRDNVIVFARLRAP